MFSERFNEMQNDAQKPANIIPKAPEWSSMSPILLRAPIYKGNIEGKTVAIKILGSQAIEFGEKNYDNEINCLKSLSHQHIIKILRDKNNQALVGPFFVLEYAANGDLYDHIITERTNITWSSRLHIISHVANALTYIHSQGIVHADIKPENIMQFERDVWKLIDFEYARSAPKDGSGRSLNVDEDINGTAAYAAPEIFNPLLGFYSVKVDIFSLAMVMYVFAEFTQPEDGAGMCDNLEKYHHDVIYQDLRPTVETALKFPQYNTLMCRMWHKLPLQRPSALEVEQEIQKMKPAALSL